MSAYVIVDVDVHQPELYKDYLAQITPTVIACGGRYLARGADVSVVSGDWQPKRIVMMEFPDQMTAEHWVTAKEYAPIHALRNKYATANMVIVNGHVDVKPTSN
ncbi:DUF1330 domain-containing protein [Echinimonas agarilytica]|uniref:DUF1330 domain-containing protein n=1 Tax=Echinimonas agarilytica TaxID=1215918 RepID=A0AA41W7M2_9GAMM|nr:DUF1330 domain-containing protein [Echinimonas agarilytica]MCM2680221.1 DUF1330 domain-containing protein [Echinimonas agarilytica]